MVQHIRSDLYHDCRAFKVPIHTQEGKISILSGTEMEKCQSEIYVWFG